MNDSFSKPVGADVSATSAIATGSVTSWISVADLLARQVPLHSSEAVAILAELCGVLLAQGDAAIPHTADVLISGAGQLSIRAHDGGESDPGALGRMLHSLLDTANPSAALRLFVSQAISSDRYQSVSAFSEALTSYEASGRNKLIQAVHDRWLATRSAPVSSVPIPLRPEPEQENKAAAKPNAEARGIPRWAFAIVAVAVVSSGAVGAWVAAGAKPVSIPAVSFSVPATIQRALSWLGETKPSDVAAAEPESSDPKRARATKPKASNARARTNNPVLDAATASGLADTASATESADRSVLIVLTERLSPTVDVGTDPSSSTSGSPLAASDETSDSLERDTSAVESAPVYSSAFPEVVPPVMTTRQMMPPHMPTSGMEAASTIELVVDESGKVERVRLISRPSAVLAVMLLSAAKNLQFRPALNDGRPVKYRLMLDVTTTRP
jgi:hypothetical protein